MSHVNLCSGCVFKCLAGSDCLFISECSLSFKIIYVWDKKRLKQQEIRTRY